MASTQILNFAKLRIVVGCLGERTDPSWWHSGMFSPESKTYLAPVFPRTQWLSRATAVAEAASRIHDEHIGVGRVFHLFRLPESIEQQIPLALQGPTMAEELASLVKSIEAATTYLAQYSPTKPPPADTGPIRIGGVDDLTNEETLATIAATYHRAFNSAARAFPFVSERA